MTKIAADGSSIALSTSNIGMQAKILGTADAFRYIKLLPGVQVTNDYTAGISIHGCEYSHTIVDMDGATIFYPYHLLGLFSLCNADHFPSVVVEKSIHTPQFPNRLGGKISILPHRTIPDKFGMAVDVGMISSGISLAIPLSARCALYLSGRLSYVNLLYSPILSNQKNKLNYDFYDTNLTFIYKHSDSDQLSISALYSNDGLKTENSVNKLMINTLWDNLATVASWSHRGDISHKMTISASQYTNNMSLEMPHWAYKMPTNLLQIGIKEDVEFLLNEKWTLCAGGAYEFTRVREYDNHTQYPLYNNTSESRLYTQATYHINDQWQIAAGAKATYYCVADYNKIVVDPSLTLKLSLPHDNTLSLHAGIYHQFLHQAGFNNLGLPIDFWFVSNADIEPQKAYSVSALFKGRIAPIDIDVTAEIYYKQIYNQPEYVGGVMEFAGGNGLNKEKIKSSDGFNTGLDIMLQKSFGKLSGWISYSLGFARRIIPGIADYYVPSSQEALNNLSLSINYKLNNHWTFGSNFTYGTGAPITPVKAAYILHQNIISEYGEYNSARLPDYHRLDLSATYTFASKKNSPLRHSINLSIVNVYAGENVVYEYFTVDDGKLVFDRVSTLISIMPSISYRMELGK